MCHMCKWTDIVITSASATCGRRWSQLAALVGPYHHVVVVVRYLLVGYYIVMSYQGGDTMLVRV